MNNLVDLPDELLLGVLMYYIMLSDVFACTEWPTVFHPFHMRLCNTSPRLCTAVRRKYLLSLVCRRFASLLRHVSEASMCAYILSNEVLTQPGVSMLLPVGMKDTFYASLVPFLSAVYNNYPVVPIIFEGLCDVRITSEYPIFATVANALKGLPCLQVFHYKQVSQDLLKTSIIFPALLSMKKLVEFGLHISFVDGDHDTDDLDLTPLQNIKRWLLYVRIGEREILDPLSMLDIQHIALAHSGVLQYIPHRLVSLDFSNGFTFRIAEIHQRCPALRFLNLQDTDEGFEFDKSQHDYHPDFDVLRDMRLEGLNISGWTFGSFKQAIHSFALTRLKHLVIANLEYCRIHKIETWYLQQCTNVEFLDISGNLVMATLLLPRLRNLVARGLRSGSDLKLDSNKLTSLRQVDISNGSVAYVCKHELQRLPSLAVVIVQGCSQPFKTEARNAAAYKRRVEGKVLPVYYRRSLGEVFVVT